MAAEQYGAWPVITVGGREAPARVMAAVRRVVVETDINGPDSCRLIVNDPDRALLGTGPNSAGFELGVAVTIAAGLTGKQHSTPVFDGTIYSVGFDYDEHGAFTTVLAYDHSYALYTGLHTKTYQNVTDSDLATQLAGEVGLQVGTIRSTPIVHDHVAQMNETHWAFLARRAREVDHLVRVTGQALDFVPSDDSSQAPEPGDYDSTDSLQLVPGGNLERLTARITAAQQVAQVQVRGWDVKQKQAVVATATAKTRSATTKDKPADVAAKFGSPTFVTVDLPLATRAECDAAAAAVAERVASSALHADGTAIGDPRLTAGATVSIGQTGGRFDGKFTVSRARHGWDRHGYRTAFTISGSHDRSVLGLVSGAGATHPASSVGGGSRVDGVVIGTVTNCTDPDHRGRVKLHLPWLSDDYESDWARVVQLGAGDQRGLLLLPEVNDEVLVAFEQGDTRRPFVLGGLYNGVDKAPFGGGVDSGSGKVNTRALRSRSGHELIFSDEQGKEKIELHTKDSKVTLTLDATDGSLTIETKGDVTVNSGGKANVTSKGDISIDAGGSATVNGKRGLTLSSDATVTVSGKAIKLN